MASGLLTAADAFDGRLPELFGDFDRSDFPVPVRYLRAGSPQAWASAATLAAARLVR